MAAAPARIGAPTASLRNLRRSMVTGGCSSGPHLSALIACHDTAEPPGSHANTTFCRVNGSLSYTEDTRKKPRRLGRVGRIFFAELSGEVFVLAHGQVVVEEEEDGPHDQAGYRRPVHDPAGSDEEDAEILGMAQIAVEALRCEAVFGTIDVTPADDDDEDANEGDQRAKRHADPIHVQHELPFKERQAEE